MQNDYAYDIDISAIDANSLPEGQIVASELKVGLALQSAVYPGEDV